MNLNNFTIKSQEAVQQAVQLVPLYVVLVYIT